MTLEAKTVVFLEASLAKLGGGLDLEGIRMRLQEAAGVHIKIVAGVGGRPEVMSSAAAAGAGRLVLGLGQGEYHRSAWQAQARRAGIDPLGIEVLDLGTHAALVHPGPEATDKAFLLTAGAVAAVAAFPGSSPENSKPCLPTKVSRRSIFTFNLLEYRPVPSIRDGFCRAEEGCTLCARECPWEALDVGDTGWWLEKSRCRSCGVCLPACPHGALVLPGYAPRQLGARLSTLLDSSLGSIRPRGLLFICHRVSASLTEWAPQGLTYPAGWLPVEVPCLDLLPPAWLLWGLTRGAAAVATVCSGARCPHGREKTVRGRMDFARRLLSGLGGQEDVLKALVVTDGNLLGRELEILAQRWLDETGGNPRKERFTAWFEDRAPSGGGRGRSPAGSMPPPDFTPAGSARILLELRELHGAAGNGSASRENALAHPHSPFGAVRVLDKGCTACGLCARACPAEALSLGRQEGDLTLSFEHSRCTACGDCLPACPGAEAGVLQLDRVTDLGLLGRGRVVLHRSRELSCEGCGAPIASEALVARLVKILEEPDTPVNPVAATAGRYCPSCRIQYSGAMENGRGPSPRPETEEI